MMFTQKRLLQGLCLLAILGAGGAIALGKIPNPMDLVQDKHQTITRIPVKVSAQNAVDLRSLAKITPEEAKAAAKKYLPGEVTEIELENEDRNLVYEVTINQTEIYVDAGNGKVLFTESEDLEDEDSVTQNRPRSSIQLPFDEDDD